MKALSIRQPWAWAILHGGKRIENRDWKGCAYRGPILLHAGKSVGTIADFHHAVEDVLDVVSLPATLALEELVTRADARPWRPGRLPLGGIVGRAKIVGVLSGNESQFEGWAARKPEHDAQRVWWAGGFALVLADVEPLPFVPWKGELGLFNVPDDYATNPAPAAAERGP